MSNFDEVRCQRLIVEDKKGGNQAVISASTEGISIKLANMSTKITISLDGECLNIQSSINELLAITASVKPTSNCITMYHTNSKEIAAMIMANSAGLGITILDKNGVISGMLSEGNVLLTEANGNSVSAQTSSSSSSIILSSHSGPSMVFCTNVGDQTKILLENYDESSIEDLNTQH